MEANFSTVFINQCIGKELLDNSGNKCGKIKDFLIDTSNSYVPFVIVGENGFLGTGIGDRNIIVPLGAIKMNNSEAAQYFMNVSQEKLKNAPRYDKERFGDQMPQLFIEIHDYYGTEQGLVPSGTISEPEQEHQSYEGSDQITQNEPADNRRISDEVDYDKIIGINKKE